MNNDNYKVSEFILSPFIETEETKKIKQYTKKLKQLNDFKNLKIYFVQYNDTDTLKGKLKLVDFYNQLKRKTLAVTTSFFPVFGSHNYFTKKISIFIDRQIKINRLKSVTIDTKKLKLEMQKDPNALNKTCCSILKTMYHEKRHQLQMQTINNSFESIMCQIERNLFASLYRIKYLKKHNSWYIEIDANNYGVNKALEYYSKNTEDTSVDLEFLRKLQAIYKSNELTYDFDSFFTMYNVYHEKIPFYSFYRNAMANIAFKTKNMAWHKVLYGNKSQLKSVSEMLNNPLINEIDPKFVNNVLTSKYLNRKTNYNDLDYDTLIKLSSEFQKKLSETCSIVDNELNSNEKNINIKDLTRLKNNIKYYKAKISLLQSKIHEYDKYQLQK